MKKHRIDLDREELATVLAALRYYQDSGMGDPFNRPDWLHDIAVPDDGSDTSLDAEAIDELCERINCDNITIDLPAEDDTDTCPECQRSFGPHYSGPCNH